MTSCNSEELACFAGFAGGDGSVTSSSGAAVSAVLLDGDGSFAGSGTGAAAFSKSRELACLLSASCSASLLPTRP